jgi:hypothetical protein
MLNYLQIQANTFNIKYLNLVTKSTEGATYCYYHCYYRPLKAQSVPPALTY